MQDKRRWLTSVCKEAGKAQVKMPWVRGDTRAAFVAKRAVQEVTAKKSAQA